MWGVNSVVVVVSVSHQNSGLWSVLSPASMVHQSTTGREVSPTPSAPVASSPNLTVVYLSLMSVQVCSP